MKTYIALIFQQNENFFAVKGTRGVYMLLPKALHIFFFFDGLGTKVWPPVSGGISTPRDGWVAPTPQREYIQVGSGLRPLVNPEKERALSNDRGGLFWAFKGLKIKN